MVACSPWLSAELALVRPQGVVVLGATAGRVLFGSTIRVTALRGRVLDWPEKAIVCPPADWVVVTTHPSAVLRSEDREEGLNGLVADLEIAARRLG
jgi:DNA polymerase